MEPKNPQWAALRRPFDPHELEWRVGTVRKDGTACQLLAYITSRAVMDRLDDIVGAPNWGNDFKPNPLGGMLCGIWIQHDGHRTWKWDGAEATAIEAVKGGISDSMKRAAVQWGIGRYLYRLDTQWVPVRAGWAKGGNQVNITKDRKHIGHAAAPPLPNWALPTAGTGSPFIPPTSEDVRIAIIGKMSAGDWEKGTIRELLKAHGARMAVDLKPPAAAAVLTIITTTTGAEWSATKGA